MIRALRRRHRRVTLALAVCLPIALVTALASRPAEPLDDNAFADRSEPDRPASDRNTLDLGSSPGPNVSSTLWASERIVELTTRAAIDHPDVLVYWIPSAGSGAGSAALPADARLLGPLGGVGTRRFRLPPDGQLAGSRLILFSLGHGTRVTTIPLGERL